MKLYCHPASTTSRIVMLFAAEEGIDLDCQVVDLFTGEHLKPSYASLNPNSLVPMLEDGDFRLTESSAILKYLAELKGSAAYPKPLRERAHVNEMMDWFNANFYRDFAYGLVYSQVFPHHRRPSDEVQAGTVAWGRDKARGWLRILDEHLLGPRKPYVCGERITLADYLGAEMVYAGALVHCDFATWPNVDRWLSRMKALKSWPKVHETFDAFVASTKDAALVPI
jgi:glutathione S-transferase